MAFGCDPLRVLPAVVAQSRRSGRRVKERQPPTCPKTLTGIWPHSSAATPPGFFLHSSVQFLCCGLLLLSSEAGRGAGSDRAGPLALRIGRASQTNGLAWCSQRFVNSVSFCCCRSQWRRGPAGFVNKKMDLKKLM